MILYYHKANKLIKPKEENNMTLPKTKEQKQFEETAPAIISLLSQLPEQSRNNVFDYAIRLYNKEVFKND